MYKSTFFTNLSMFASVGVFLLLTADVNAQTIVTRASFTVSGGGNLNNSVGGNFGGETDFDDESEFGIDFIALTPLSRDRIGLFLQYTPERALDFGTDLLYETGSSLLLDLFYEHTLHKKGALRFHINAFGGAVVFFSDEDLEKGQQLVNDEDENKVGFNLGAGVGTAYRIGGVKLRADFYLLHENCDLIETSNTTASLTNNRFVLATGIEF